ncbi:MAG: acetyl-CoA carboxylase biotin carboxyl carrier protein [Rhodospirillales bacterium]|nr:acetyl-CoA carboxylase biotin carboxyl carrier protein [Rhodospirillales bacterium]
MSKAEKPPKNPSGIDMELVRQLAELLDETGLSEIEYGRDEWHIRVSRGGTATSIQMTAPGPGAVLAAPGAAATDPDDLSAHPSAVCSPMVGVVYTSSDPETPAFVKVGDQVNEGDTLLLVEAMKVFNPIRAPKSGKVSRILISNGSPVEFGEALMIVE